MKTRKQLIAENTQLRAQLDVHQHVTRKALHERYQSAEKLNEQLGKELDAMTKQRDALNDKLAAAEAEGNSANN